MFSERGDIFSEPIGVGRGGIKIVFVDPVCELVMALVFAIAHRFEELGVAEGAADVLGRASECHQESESEPGKAVLRLRVTLDRPMPSVLAISVGRISLTSTGEFAAARPWYERTVTEAEKDTRPRPSYGGVARDCDTGPSI